MAVPLPPPTDFFSRRTKAALWVGLTVSLSLLLFLYRYLGDVAGGPPYGDWREVLLNEVTGSVGGVALLLVLALPFMRRFPLARGNLGRRLPLYAGTLVVYSILHTTSNWGLRSALYPLFGLGSYGYGPPGVRYAMEFSIDAVGFSVAVVMTHLVWEYAAARGRELHAEQLERALTQSRLQSLQLQLQPHFLFNALNTISSRMYDDPTAADAMLTHLASLLRASLNTRDTHEVPLEAELATLEHYLAILRGRFGDGCRVRVDVPEEVRRAVVPALLLQPLVENAVRHGNLTRIGAGTITVKGWRENGDLRLEVDDDGPGPNGEVERIGHGVGLPATADRLALLYPGAHRFEAASHAHGFRVRMSIPWREGGTHD
ncbi:MAG: histidine kinase [Cytophagaceae bacterium]|nr:histidine kinase [Gemmatimonadaceae bacterium]